MASASSNKNKFYFSHFNIRSLCSDFDSFSDYVAAEAFDIYGLSETWLSEPLSSNSSKIHNYNLVRKDRDGRGGGVAFYVVNSLKFQVIDTSAQQSALEQLWIRTKINGKIICFGTLYRPPMANLASSLDDLENAIVSFLPDCDVVMFGGDLNVDMLEAGSPGCSAINQFFNKYNLTQLVQSPTRISQFGGKLIDVLVTSNPKLISDVQVINMDNISDHHLVLTDLDLQKNRVPISYRTYRDYSHFVLTDFVNDLFNVNWQNIFNMTNIDQMITFFQKNVTDVFNIHAPLKTSRFSKPPAPWITDNIKFMMKLRQKALTRYKKLKTDTSLYEYKQLRNLVTSAVRNEKKAYLEYKFRLDPASFWKTLNNLNITSKSSDASALLQTSDAADQLNSFFIRSIPQIGVSALTNNNQFIDKYSNKIHPNVHNAFKFEKVNEAEVERIISSIKTSSVGSDGIDIKMITLLIPYLTPYITYIINKALSSNTFPLSWKMADVIPVPKNDVPSELSHYRPISILLIFSKILERIMFTQLNKFVLNNSIIPVTQSGFRARHDTTTALLHVCDDIFRSLDSGNVTALVLLDYSKAFDTLDHNLLLTKLKYFGLHDSALILLNNYLSNGKQRVRLAFTFSEYSDVNQGVPQGSILGPLLFPLYTCDFSEFLTVCKSHQYADDTQIYHSFQLFNVNKAIRNINSDLDTIVKVSKSHKLVLNGSKSKLLLFGMPDHQCMEVIIDGTLVVPSSCEKNLGILLDNQLKFKNHVSSVLQKAYYKLKVLYMHANILSTLLLS